MEPVIRFYRSSSRHFAWSAQSQRIMLFLRFITDLRHARLQVSEFDLFSHSRLKGHASRCISSVLDGNYAVVASILGDLVDNINMSQAFAILPATASIASAIGCV